MIKKSLWQRDAVQSNDALHQIDGRRHRRSSKEDHRSSDRHKSQYETRWLHDTVIPPPIRPQPCRDHAPSMIDREIETVEQAPNDKSITGTVPKPGDEHRNDNRKHQQRNKCPNGWIPPAEP